MSQEVECELQSSGSIAKEIILSYECDVGVDVDTDKFWDNTVRKLFQLLPQGKYVE